MRWAIDSGSSSPSPSLDAAAAKIVDNIKSKNLAAFNGDISSDGNLIVRREPDWDESNTPLKDRPDDSDYLSFNGMSIVAVKEYEISFPKANLQDSTYSSLYRQFRDLVIASGRNYPGHEVSTNLLDGFWFRERQLGPSIFFKVASDEAAIIYLTKERSQWKVWRLECWERGAFQRNLP